MTTASTSTRPVVGWIGAGQLGSAAIGRLARCGWPVWVYNRTGARARALADDLPSVSAVTTPEALAAPEVQGVVVCVSSPDAVTETLLGRQGACSGPGRPAWVLDLSTWSPATAARVSEQLVTVGVRYIECPVSGGPEGAAAGRLAAVVRAGDRDLVRPLVDDLAVRVTELSEGSPMAAKLANNLAEAVNLWGACEALALGLAAGLTYEDTVATMRSMRGASAYLDVLDGVRTGAVEASASLRIRIKDLRFALEVAASQDLSLPLADRLNRLLADWVTVVGPDADQTTCLDAVAGDHLPAVLVERPRRSRRSQP